MALGFALLLRSKRGSTLPDLPRVHSSARCGLLTLERLRDQSVAEILKRRAEAAGFDPTIFSGHSLRAGFVTSALHHGADVLRVMDVTRHREVSTLKAYDPSSTLAEGSCDAPRASSDNTLTPRLALEDLATAG
jgi:hypothetical protein